MILEEGEALFEGSNNMQRTRLTTAGWTVLLAAATLAPIWTAAAAQVDVRFTADQTVHGGASVTSDRVRERDRARRQTSGTNSGTLALEADTCQSDANDQVPGLQVIVELWLRDLQGPATGFQAFLEYDDATMSYDGSLSSYTPVPFTLHVQPIATAEVAPGEIRLDGSVAPLEPAIEDDALLATLVFTVNAACAPVSAGFDLTQPFDSELSFEGLALDTTLIDSPAIVPDGGAPEITCPADVAIECAEPAEPGILLGIVEGGVAIYYNDNGGGENPANQAYLRAQFSQANTNGSEFNFDNTPLTGNGLLSWFGLFQAVPDQFGLDLILPAPSFDGSVTLPTLTAYDNVDGSIANRAAAGPVVWSIGDYKGASSGPADPANEIINSLFRSSGLDPGAVSITQNDLTQSGTLFTVEIAGELVSDGKIHWFDPAAGSNPDFTTDMPVFGMDGSFFFSGTLTYDSAGDDGSDGVDFYGGTIVISANSPTTEVGFATAVDNCTLFPVVTYKDSADLSGCNGTGTITRTWTATDDCGNASSCEQTITVQDSTPPELTVPPDIAVGYYESTAPANTGQASASDNCGPVPPPTFQDSASDTCPVVITRTWTVEDACGNSVSQDQLITVPDEVPHPDINNDGTVNAFDLALLLGAWGPCVGPPSACCNADGPGACLILNEVDCQAAGGQYLPESLCDACPPAACAVGAGDCCAANGSAGCDQVDCCTAVCDLDSDCCDVDWDASCAALAATTCLPCFAVPANDDCAMAVPVGDGSTAFNVSGATTDGPAHGACEVDGQTYNDIWYHYTASCSGILDVSTCGQADFDTALALYSGCDCDTMVLFNCDDDTAGCAKSTSRLSGIVSAGSCHTIRIGGSFSNDYGSGTVTLTCGAGLSAGGPIELFLCPADLNCDGTVDSSDLAALLGAWGPVDP